MKQEEKELLLKDLCARLSHGVIVSTPKGVGHQCSINQTIFGNEYGVNIEATKRDNFNDNECDIKPYLCPISSMTKKETKELFKEIGFEFTCNTCGIPAHYNYEFAEQIKGIPTITNVEFVKVIDWLNAHHFDYRGLIEKGLAIEAPKGMYNED